MIGPQTGQVLNNAIRSKHCRVFTTAASKNQQVREHAYSKIWDGSSKAASNVTVKVIKYFQRRFDYIVAQGKGVPTQISADLEALSRHPFRYHQRFMPKISAPSGPLT